MWLLCGLYTYLDVFEDFFFAIAMDHQKITGRRLFFFLFCGVPKIDDVKVPNRMWDSPFMQCSDCQTAMAGIWWDMA